MPPPFFPPPGLARECLRTALDGLLLPLRSLRHLQAGKGRRRAVAADLSTTAEVEEPPALNRLPDRPLEILISAAEASGEAHAARLTEAVYAACAAAGAPRPRIRGLGGGRLARLGVEILGNPVARAAMGSDAARELPFFMELLGRVEGDITRRPIDLFLPVDSPALHVPLARIARRRGARVAHFVPPQYWAWAPWRVGAYRGAVDLTLSILPFEPAWFSRHGVPVAHVGHPILDGLGKNDPDSGPDPASGRAGLVLLPGSRSAVIERNLPWMLKVAARLRRARPGLPVSIPHDREESRPRIDQILRSTGADRWVDLPDESLHTSLSSARTALSVSGTVLLDLLHHRLPSVVIYRVDSRRAVSMAPRLLTVPWFSSVNLLAGEEVLPEFCFADQGPVDEVVAALDRALFDEAHRASTMITLDRAAARLGPPGAVRRAAGHALGLVQS